MRRLIAPVAALAMLAACQQAEEPAAPPVAETTAAPAPTSEPTPELTPEAQPVSCEAERGLDAAQALADQCRQVSPATHPPCHPANPCAMIQAEIDRSCALWAEDDDVPAECGA
jgi:hypothetical protein